MPLEPDEEGTYKIIFKKLLPDTEITHKNPHTKLFLNNYFQIPEMSVEPDGEAPHQRLGQDHLPLLHLSCPHLNTLHVLYRSNDEIMESYGNYG